MPYVNVWVDDPYDCCPKCKKLDDEIRDALKFLRDGENDKASQLLGIAVNDESAIKRQKIDNELASIYSDWLRQVPRPDFLTFAHRIRKETRT